MNELNETYILRLPNKMLKAFDRESVQTLLDEGSFHPKDYVFNEATREWLRPFDMTGVFTVGPVSDSMVFEMPKFTPPSIPKKPVSEEEHEALKEEVKKIKHELNNKIAVIDAIKFTRDDLEEDFHKVAGEKLALEEELSKITHSEKDVRADLVVANNKIDDLNSQVVNLEKQATDLLLIKDELLNIKDELDKSLSVLKNELREKELGFKSFQEVNYDLEQKILELQDENEKLRKKQNIYLDYVKNEKKRADSFESNVTKLSEGIIKLKNLRKKDQIAIQNLENYKKTQSNKEARELDRLIGDTFEIDNSAHWYIEMGGEVKGPFSFHDMKSLQKYDKITEDTPIKKSYESFWTTAGKDFELTANIITHSEVTNGEEVFRYFVNRSDYRAPFHGAALITIEGKEYTGFCTSLSQGGAFIELAALEDEMILQGESAQLKINAGTLSQDLTATVLMRNFSKEKPCGIGLQFQFLNDEQRNVIMSYVSSYLENIKKTA